MSQLTLTLQYSVYPGYFYDDLLGGTSYFHDMLCYFYCSDILEMVENLLIYSTLLPTQNKKLHLCKWNYTGPSAMVSRTVHLFSG